MTGKNPHRRLVRLCVALGACLALAGVVRPWSPKKSSPPPTGEPSSPDASASAEPSGAHPQDEGASDAEVAKFVAATQRTSTGPSSRPASARDPFYLAVELDRGLTLAAQRLAEEERRAASRAAAEAPASRPAVDPAEVERVRALRLLGVVGSADGGPAVAVLAGVGRVRVGDRLPGSPFTLHAASAAGVELRADDVRVEIPLRRTKGGVSRSEKP